MIIEEQLVQKTKDWVASGAGLDADCAAHDWWHIQRVWNNARTLQAREGGRRLVIDLAVLLHDVDDYKLTGGDGSPVRARAWLASLGALEALVEEICQIIVALSFKGAGVPTPMESLEGKIVQDADRLDAIGAIGIARAFSYGGSKGRALFVPGQEPGFHGSQEDYRAAHDHSQGHTIAHFHEKLLLLADRMQTRSAREMARARHEYLLGFLDQFHREWQGTS